MDLIFWICFVVIVKEVAKYCAIPLLIILVLFHFSAFRGWIFFSVVITIAVLFLAWVWWDLKYNWRIDP